MKHVAPARHVTLKTVLLAFAVSFVVFGMVLLRAFVFNQSATKDPAKADASLGRVRTVTLFFRKTVDELSGAVLLTVDTRKMEVVARGIAPDQEVGGRSLQELYKVGSLYAATQLAEKYDTASDGVLSFSVSNVAAFLVYVQDRLQLTLPEQVDILPPGESTLTPMQVADLLRYQDWSNGSTGQAKIHAEVVTAILNRYWTNERDLEQDFKKLTTLCDERLYISQYKAISEEIEAVAKHNDGNIAKAESD